MSELKKPDSFESDSSDKTEMIIHKTELGLTLEDNLIQNFESKLKSIDVVKLYNSILTEKDVFESEEIFFDFVHIHLIKCRSLKMYPNANDISVLLDKINISNYRKYLCLELIVYIVNIDFKVPVEMPRKKSGSSLWKSMYI